jgi:hypothetical protein
MMRTISMLILACTPLLPIIAQVDSVNLDEDKPPFSGTIFIDPDIITENDPTMFLEITYAGTGTRRMFDRRERGRITVDAFLFNVKYSDGIDVEFQVNPEFDSLENAAAEAEKYARVIGRIPTVLRKDVETVCIHKGNRPFGGGNHNLLIHTEQADSYVSRGILEETFVHEASHTSLDAEHAKDSAWVAAQDADGNFISNYARDHPFREDIAESFLPYLAVKYRADRISPELKNTIETTIPSRLEYFDDQAFDLTPIR